MLSSRKTTNPLGSPFPAFIPHLVYLEDDVSSHTIVTKKSTTIGFQLIQSSTAVQHHSLFLDFLTNGTVSCGGLQSSLQQDFANETAKLEIQVFGLIGKLLSGPWMKAFYTSAADQLILLKALRS